MDENTENEASDLFDLECSRLDALKAWDKVFDHQFFKDLIEAEEEEETKQRTS